MLLGDELQRFADRVGDLLGRLHDIGRDIDDADQQVLAFEQLHQVHRHMRVHALERDGLDRALRDRREDLLVLAPLGAERGLPVDVGLDAVAVADVHDSLALQALGGAVERGDAQDFTSSV